MDLLDHQPDEDSRLSPLILFKSLSPRGLDTELTLTHRLDRKTSGSSYTKVETVGE